MVGGATFGILLIHSNCQSMRQLIYHDLIQNEVHFLAGEWWYALPMSLIIFGVCALMDIFRKQYLEEVYLRTIYKLLKI